MLLLLLIVWKDFERQYQGNALKTEGNLAGVLVCCCCDEDKKIFTVGSARSLYRPTSVRSVAADHQRQASIHPKAATVTPEESHPSIPVPAAEVATLPPSSLALPKHAARSAKNASIFSRIFASVRPSNRQTRCSDGVVLHDRCYLCQKDFSLAAFVLAC